MWRPQTGRVTGLLGRYFSTTLEEKISSSTHIPRISKNVVQLREVGHLGVQGKHLANLAKILSNIYRTNILNKDLDVVSRLWFIVLTRLIDLTATYVEDVTFFHWNRRIPNRGSIEEHGIKNINIYEVVRLVKYFSFSKIFHEKSVFSKSLEEASFLAHLVKKDIQNKPKLPLAGEISSGEKSFFGRIFVPPPEPGGGVNELPVFTQSPCDLTSLPSSILSYQWVLDSSFNFFIPTEFLSHVLSVSDFVNAVRATLLLNLNNYIKLNWDIICFSKLLMYFSTFSSHYLITSPFFSKVILSKIDEISKFLSESISSNIKTLKPRTLALIANASGTRGDLMILDCIEKALKDDDGTPTELAMSLHPNHLENICYAFAKLRIVRKGLYKALATVIEYKFDEFEPVVTLNLIFSYARVNHLEMVQKYLIMKLCSYSVKQLAEVSERVLANAVQALSGVSKDHEPYLLLLSAVAEKGPSGELNEFYSNVLDRLLKKGVMTEPLESCQLYKVGCKDLGVELFGR